MQYADTGKFTNEQRAICKKIKQLINDGKRKGLLFKFVNNKVKAYIDKEVENYAADHRADDLKDYGHPLKSLNCGILNGKNCKEEYFEQGEIEDDIEDIVGD
jgi:hypothetical protein